MRKTVSSRLSASISATRGLTFLGFLCVAILVGGYFQILLALWSPVTSDIALNDIFDELRDDPSSNQMTKEEIKKRIMRRISVNSIYGIGANHLDTKKVKDGWEFRLYKEDRVPLLGISQAYILYITDHTFVQKKKKS